jgi:murein DD-endopeptidase MepM/ murein hydrolase activator NlpD
MTKKKKKGGSRSLWRVAIWVIVGFIAVLGTTILLLNYVGNPSTEDLASVEPEPVQVLFGIPLENLEAERLEIHSGETMGAILSGLGLTGPQAAQLLDRAQGTFDPRKLRQGTPYRVIRTTDSTRRTTHLILETNPYEYVVFHVGDSLYAEAGKRSVKIMERVAWGRIETSLWDAFVNREYNPALAVNMADIFAWTVDFFRTQPGDYFKLIYLEEWVDDTINLGPGRILAAEFNQSGKGFQAFFFSDSAGYQGYFDRDGQSLKRAFLKAPLDYFRISSRFSGKRFHPVQKRWKAHLGTDYAAPHGTPIRSTANGVVEKKGYTAGNGNYVKVKHNGTYSTQYLHMSKFAKGVNVGTRVSQGQVIGYVGSTGLATGPHVCYRFWKNGKQVDPLKEKLPNAEPIEKRFAASFAQQAAQQQSALDTLTLQP